jgi:two-component system sensor histidine kinase ChiS
MDAMTVLCVENDADSLNTLTFMLEGIGYDVMAATSAGQALDLLSKKNVDGVLLEYNLPDASGSSVRAEMKRIKPDVPVLLLTGVGEQTRFLMRFFDSYLRSESRMDEDLEDPLA